MLNSVSFGTRMGVFDKANVDAPQAHAKPVAPQAPEKPAKNHKTAKTIAKVVAAAVVIAGALAAGSHYKVFDPAKIGKAVGKLKDVSWLQWAKEPAKKTLGGLDTAGKFIMEKSSAASKAVCEYAGKGVEWVKGLFTKKTA